MQKNGTASSSFSDRQVPSTSTATASGTESQGAALGVDLTATIISVSRGDPRLLAIEPSENEGPRRWTVPSMSYSADSFDCLDIALRDGIHTLTGLQLGHTEQLESEVVTRPNGYDGAAPQKRIGINYVALASDKANSQSALRNGAAWIPLYDLLPWEDWRSGRPPIIANIIAPKLEAWSGAEAATASSRRNDVGVCFGASQGGWDEEKVGERLALLLASGTLASVLTEHAAAGRGARKSGPTAVFDDRSLLGVARALGRLRAQIKIKPIVFELVPDQFTLYELQQTVEAILGPPLHKQNFRRLVEHMGLVEPTGEIKSHTGGRPAQLFRFRPSVVLEHVHPGMRVRGARL